MKRRQKTGLCATQSSEKLQDPIPAYAGMTKNAYAGMIEKGIKMKHMMVVLGLMLFAIPAVAVSVCAKDSVVTVVLDPSIDGASYTYNNSTRTWKTVFSYGNVSGISTCVSIAPTGSQNITKTTDGTPLLATGGETAGRYCWCKMTHPMSSLWAFHYAHGDAATCASYCAARCGGHVQDDASLRSGLFGSVATANEMF